VLDAGAASGGAATRSRSALRRPDPVTDKDTYLTATVKGTDKAARGQANDKLAEFRAQVLKQRAASTTATIGYAIDEWERFQRLMKDLALRSRQPTIRRPANRVSNSGRARAT